MKHNEFNYKTQKLEIRKKLHPSGILTHLIKISVNFTGRLIVYGKIGRIASEEVLMALLRSKCLPMLLYGTEACPINAAVKI